ncbi:hypothetical protein Tco_1230163 [Tanacetum coccineum]
MVAQTQGRHDHEIEADFEFTTAKDVSTANVSVNTACAESSTANPKVKTAGVYVDDVAAEGLVYIRRSATKRKDKGKAIMEESEPTQTKTKIQQEQERLGFEEALRLQEQFNEEERQRIDSVHEEVNTFKPEEWENIQAQIEADEELAHRSYMCNYIKHMGSHTLQQLRGYSFDEIKVLFEATMKRVNTFTPMENDDTVPKVVAGSSKRNAKEELGEESLKRQKIGEGSEPTEESKDKESDDKRAYNFDVLQVDQHLEMADDLLTVMCSASSVVTYTSVYTDSEPGRVFWGADEEISDGGSPRVIVYGYDGLKMQPVHDPDYVSEPVYPEYIPLEDEHVFPAEEQPLPPVDSPTTESPGYVVESDPEEDPEEYEDDETEDGPVDYPMDGGDDGDDNDGDSSGDDADDEDEHLALTDSAIVVPTVEPISPPEGTEPVIPLPSTDISTTRARIIVRLQASISLPPEAEVERLLAMTTPSPSPPISLSPPSARERLARCTVTAVFYPHLSTYTSWVRFRVARLFLQISTPPSSPLSPWSSPLPQIPFPPLPLIPSPSLPLSPPLPVSAPPPLLVLFVRWAIELR